MLPTIVTKSNDSAVALGGDVKPASLEELAPGILQTLDWWVSADKHIRHLLPKENLGGYLHLREQSRWQANQLRAALSKSGVA
jgi:hypothetical protein